MIRVMVALTAVFAGAAARAEDSKRIVGTWVVSEKEDRFGEGGSYIAMTPDGAGNVLGVRCIERVLSIGIADGSDDPKPLVTGSRYVVKLRTDKEPAVTTTGLAIADRLIQVETMADMVRTMRKGKETAVRIESESGVSRTMVFKTSATGKAFSRIAAECKLD